jgi:hypothetical protein
MLARLVTLIIQHMITVNPYGFNLRDNVNSKSGNFPATTFDVASFQGSAFRTEGLPAPARRSGRYLENDEVESEAAPSPFPLIGESTNSIGSPEQAHVVRTALKQWLPTTGRLAPPQAQ